jgi:hypothetical protein
MVPTIFGILFALAAISIMGRPATSMLILMLVGTLFGGTAAINLTALGNANITPAHFVLVFLIIRIFFYKHFNFGMIAAAVQNNSFLVAFAIYGAITAFLLPLVFYHDIYVPAMRALSESLYAVRPLQFTPQNITTAAYLIGTALAAMASWIVCSVEGRTDRISKAFTVIAWIHIGFGLFDVATTGTGLHSALEFFRNASYGQLDQHIEGVQRVAGIFPETSAYSGYAFTLFVLHTEFWMRNQRPAITGVTAISLLSILLLTTSSTSYISLAIYAVVMLLRLCFTPMRLAVAKTAIIFSLAILSATGLLIISIFLPDMGRLMTYIVQEMTFHKLNSFSGIQRGFWAHKGWESFVTSMGLGIGAGSFRSSGIVPAIAGSLGVFGLITMGAYVARLLRFWRLDMHDTSRRPPKTEAAYAWAAVLGLIPALLTAPSPDPGLLFAVLGGISLVSASRHVAVNPAANARPKVSRKPYPRPRPGAI